MLSKKYGPLPFWAWVAIVLALGAGYVIYKRRQSTAQNTSTSATGTDTTGNTTDTGAPGSSSGDTTPQTGGDGSNEAGGYGGGSNFAGSPLDQDLQALTAAITALIPGQGVPTTPTAPIPTSTGWTSVPTPGATTGGVTPVTTTTTPAKTTAPASGTSTATPKPVVTKPPVTSTKPTAVKITANKTGGSANPTQGVFAIH